MRYVVLLCVTLFLVSCGAKQSSIDVGADDSVIGAASVGDECGGVANIACDAASFCRFHDPSALDRSGTCAERPKACPDIAMQDMPCGADGRQYATPCHANMRGVAIVPRAECSDEQSDG